MHFPFPKASLPLRPPGIRTHNHTPLHLQILPDPPQRAGLRIQIINRHVEEPLDLAGVQVHGDDMVAAGRLQHVGHEFGGDGRAGFVLFVLARVREVGDHGGDAPRGGGAAGVDDDQEFHEPVVDVAGGGALEDEYWEGGVSEGGVWRGGEDREGRVVPSSSRTDSPIVTEVSWFEYWRTMILVSSIPSLQLRLADSGVVNVGNWALPISDQLGQLRVAIARQELDGVGRHDWRY